MNGDVLIGIDVGSSSCKVSAVDSSGTVVATAQDDYVTRYPLPGWAEQDPLEWYSVACSTTAECMRNGGLSAKRVAALAVDGPAHNVALLDSDGTVLRPTLHWSDLRSVEQAHRLGRDHGALIEKATLQNPNPSWTLAQLLWLKEAEPETWERLTCFLVTKDYVRFRLTGEPLTDRYDAIGTQLYDVENDSWSADIASLLGLRAEALPRVADPHDMAGGLQDDAASAMGLLPGTPVAVGSGDSVVEAASIGALQPGDEVIKLGTAANVNRVIPAPVRGSPAIMYPHVNQRAWFAISATNTGTATMNWFRRNFCSAEEEQARATGRNVFDLIRELSAGAPAGSDGLLFHPFLKGERSPYWDPRLSGQFAGVTMDHTRSHFARAVLEGVAYSLRDCSESNGLPAAGRRWLIGGGARSELWRQIVADVFGQTLEYPGFEDASVGSALLAGISVGVFPDWDRASLLVTRDLAKVEPEEKNVAVYKAYFDLYRGAVDALQSFSHRAGDIASEPSG